MRHQVSQVCKYRFTLTYLYGAPIDRRIQQEKQGARKIKNTLVEYDGGIVTSSSGSEWPLMPYRDSIDDLSEHSCINNVRQR